MRYLKFELSKVVILPLLMITVITSVNADFEINIFNDEKGKILIVNYDLNQFPLEEYEKTSYKHSIDRILNGIPIDTYIDDIRDICNKAIQDSFDKISHLSKIDI